jgi:hypothetical protein
MRDDDREFPDPARVEMRAASSRDIEAAVRWLKKLLASGPMFQFEVSRRAEAAGIPGSLLAKARKVAGIKAENFNDQNELATWKCWFWSLPPKPKKRGLFDDRGRDDDRGRGHRERDRVRDDDREPPWDD